MIKEILKIVYREIFSHLRKTKIYSFSLGSTSDEGHIRQLTIILKYVEKAIPVDSL